MKHGDTEAQQLAMEALDRFRNSVIDWCISVLHGYNHVAKDFSEAQMATIARKLRDEKS